MATREDFDDWNTHPITKDLKKRIGIDIEYMKNLLVQSDLEGVKDLQGRIKACLNLVEVTYEDIYE